MIEGHSRVCRRDRLAGWVFEDIQVQLRGRKGGLGGREDPMGGGWMIVGWGVIGTLLKIGLELQGTTKWRRSMEVAMPKLFGSLKPTGYDGHFSRYRGWWGGDTWHI